MQFHRRSVLAGLAATGCTTLAPAATAPVAPRAVILPAADGIPLSGIEYGAGPNGVILVPGGHGIGASWDAMARKLTHSGLRSLAIDFRGLGGVTDAQQDGEKAHLDVIGAIDWMRQTGAQNIALVGASWGGRAAGLATLERQAEISRIVFLAHGAFQGIERIAARKLFIVAREDRSGSGAVRLVSIREQFEAAREPKQLIVLDGAAHAQFLFLTDQAERLSREIEDFLLAP